MFLWDSGSSVGEIIGHSKPINAIDYRPTRPFRVITAGEDNHVCWFEGPPFRYKNRLSVSELLNAVLSLVWLEQGHREHRVQIKLGEEQIPYIK